MTAATSTAFVVREWRPYSKNTLVGFLTLELPGGLVLHGLTLHQKNRSRWLLGLFVGFVGSLLAKIQNFWGRR